MQTVRGIIGDGSQPLTDFDDAWIGVAGKGVINIVVWGFFFFYLDR